MKQESYTDPSDEPCRVNRKDQPEYYVWSTSEKSRLRALTLYIIQSIVERHRGTIKIDLATNTINIELPDEEKIACAREIEEQVSRIGH